MLEVGHGYTKDTEPLIFVVSVWHDFEKNVTNVEELVFDGLTWMVIMSPRALDISIRPDAFCPTVMWLEGNRFVEVVKGYGDRVRFLDPQTPVIPMPN